MFWLFLLSHSVLTWSFQICCLCSDMFMLISLFSSDMSGSLGFVSLSRFLLLIFVRICCGIGLFLLLILPLGMNFLSAWMMVSVMNLVS